MPYITDMTAAMETVFIVHFLLQCRKKRAYKFCLYKSFQETRGSYLKQGMFRNPAASPLSSRFDWFAVLPTKERGWALWQNPLCAVSPQRLRAKTMKVFIDEPHCYSGLHWGPFTDQIPCAVPSPLCCHGKACCCEAAFLSADSESFPETL